MGKRENKDRQVCRQVFEALGMALAEIDDPLIDDLVLQGVDPAPDASRLLVRFTPARPDLDLAAATARLEELLPELRAEVAVEVNRKRAPELLVRIDVIATP
jgi:ribosome-binding factor A